MSVEQVEAVKVLGFVVHFPVHFVDHFQLHFVQYFFGMQKMVSLKLWHEWFLQEELIIRSNNFQWRVEGMLSIEDCRHHGWLTALGIQTVIVLTVGDWAAKWRCWVLEESKWRGYCDKVSVMRLVWQQEWVFFWCYLFSPAHSNIYFECDLHLIYSGPIEVGGKALTDFSLIVSVCLLSQDG